MSKVSRTDLNWTTRLANEVVSERRSRPWRDCVQQHPAIGRRSLRHRVVKVPDAPIEFRSLIGCHEQMLRRDLLRTFAVTPLAFATGLDSETEKQRYSRSWDSLDQRACPPWYTDAKFGIFIHWGLYSVPAFAAVNVPDENPYAEWYWHSLTEGKKAQGQSGRGAMTWAFHQRVYGADFPYFDFAPMFRAELFDPDHWADVIARSGARYVALTSKHHEGVHALEER